MSILYKMSDDIYAFHCPACKTHHGVKVGGGANGGWLWNESIDEPTFSPSILSLREPRCHSFVTLGKIQFLTDCEHELAGQTVPLPEWQF